MRKDCLLTMVVAVLISTTLQAQDKSGLFAIRAGYLYSDNWIKQVPGNLLLKPDIDSKPSFFSGVSYTKVISDKTTSRNEINYQNKGMVIQQLHNGLPNKVTYNYNYISLESTIGFNIFKNFTLSLGPGINFLINKMDEEQNGKNIEIGFVTQGSYRIHRLEFSMNYFRGLNNYSEVTKVDPGFKFFNQNWRLGIGYVFLKN